MTTPSKPLLAALEAVKKMARDNCVTEYETAHGYWWRYQHPYEQPDNLEIETAIIVAFRVADVQARKSGKTYLVSSSPRPSPAVYVVACDHPDARNPAT